MKKIIILSALVLGAFTANAQSVVEGGTFKDNWSIELNAGGVTPFTHSAIIKNMRPAFGLGISKQLTPIFGLGLQGMGYVNISPSKTAIDGSDVSALAKINLMNLFGGYKGKPRVFEMEAVGGIGWLHAYVNGVSDPDTWSTRVGLNFNFNLGDSRAWTLGIKPALVYDMQGDYDRARSRFNANNAMFELTAGLAYHFKTSSGDRYFTKVKAYDQGEIDALNASVNALREQVDAKDGELNAAGRKIGGLERELEACRNKEVPVAVETIVETNRVPESIVTFKQGKSTVDASQLPNVERVASYMKKYADAKVVIKGYASPEGSAEVNAKIAAARAEAVKTILVNKYKIDASRITAEGQGVGDMFSEPDWNRVSICTIKEK